MVFCFVSFQSQYWIDEDARSMWFGLYGLQPSAMSYGIKLRDSWEPLALKQLVAYIAAFSTSQELEKKQQGSLVHLGKTIQFDQKRLWTFCGVGKYSNHPLCCPCDLMIWNNHQSTIENKPSMEQHRIYRCICETPRFVCSFGLPTVKRRARFLSAAAAGDTEEPGRVRFVSAMFVESFGSVWLASSLSMVLV